MEYLKNHPLDKLNTFGLTAKSNLFASVSSIEELKEVLQSKEAKNNELLILGGGSNILLTKDFEGLTIKIDIRGIDVVEETADKVLIKIGAGENWHNFVRHAIANNWGGIENLSLIPGTVGAAPMQNIGAYGVEIREVFDKLKAVEIVSGEVKTFNNNDCAFGYRESVFKNIYKGQFIIAEVFLELTKNQHKINTSYGAIENTLKEMNITAPSIKDVSDAVISIRQSKLPNPSEIGNAGSFFKNPTIDKIDYEGLKAEYPEIPGYELPKDQVKVPAAWLIDQCGWKGLTRGKIGVHKNQALVLVNYGGGDGQEIKELAIEIKDSVAQKFGIQLHPEVNFI